MGWRRRRAFWLGVRAALVVASGVVASLLVAGVPTSRASAAPRSVTLTYRYPATTECAGVALYYSPSRAQVDTGTQLSRVDLGLIPAGEDDMARAVVPGFDDARDWFVVLRCYDSSGNESRNSGVGVIPARLQSLPASSLLYEEDFESYAASADPEDWVDSAPNLASPGAASLFETVARQDGSIAYAAATATDIHSHLDAAGAGAWSSYEFTGRITTDDLRGSGGVTVLSGYPERQFYYRLGQVASMPYVLVKRGGGALTCAESASTGVTPTAGSWLWFRVRVTRFDGRNRVRASLWPQAGPGISGWQVDCWDAEPEVTASGRVGLFSGGDGGRQWDDLQVNLVAADGAPPAYQPTGTPPQTEPPPTAPPPVTPPPVTPPPVTPPPVTPPPVTPPSNAVGGAYVSNQQLAHWWRPGWDLASLGNDFAPGANADASSLFAVEASDIMSGGTANAEVDLDGKTESLAHLTLRPYGLANSWSVAAWVRPSGPPSGKRVILDLNGADSTTGVSRILLYLDEGGHFAIAVTDSGGRLRALASETTINLAQVPNAWYHVAAVKNGTSLLSLYVNGQLAASTNVAVPIQSDVVRVMRIGSRVRDPASYYWKGGIAGIALWRSALAGPEVTALAGSGKRSADLRVR